jgi:RNA polymerase sigma-70 factor (ECF subfamily)
MDRPEDKASSDLLKRDRETGIKQLYDCFYRPLVLFARDFLADEDEAENIVQELFIKLWQEDALARVAAGALRSYLYSSVRNACLNQLTRNDCIDRVRELKDIVIPVEAAVFIDEERIARVMREVEQLPPRARQALELVLLDGMKYKEAAVAMNISVHTVNFLLKEALKKLRQNLSSFMSQLFFFVLGRKKTTS